MDNAEQAKPTAEAKLTLAAIFFTKTGQILTRKLDHAVKSIVMPLNNGDNRLFIKNGELVTPFVKVNFRHVKNVPAAGFMLAIYEEVGVDEFDPTDMVPIAIRSLEVDFKELNKDVA
jgi:hypothetical protein